MRTAQGRGNKVDWNDIVSFLKRPSNEVAADAYNALPSASTVGNVLKSTPQELITQYNNKGKQTPQMDQGTQDMLFAGITSPQLQQPQEQPQPKAEMNPIVKEYIAKKMPIEQSKQPIQQKQPEIDILAEAKKQNEDRQSGLGWAQFAAGIGDAMAGRSPSESAKTFDNIRSNIKDETIGQAMRDKAQSATDFKNKQMMDQSDPNSQQSQAFRKMIETQFPHIAKGYGQSWSQVSAADKENIFEPMKLKENIDSRKDAMRIATMGRQDALNLKTAEKNDKKKQAINEVEERRQNINANVEQLKSMIKEDGTYEMLGSHNQDIDRLTEQIATDMAKLMDPNSVARPQEVEMIKKTLIKPGFSNSNSTATDILNNFGNEINQRADTAYRIRGLDAPQGRPQAFEGGVSQQPNVEQKVMSFMKKNNIKDPQEAIRILKQHGKM